MSDPKACPTCGAALPSDATRGVCPACLLEAGLATGGAPARDDRVPTIEELAPKFPGLAIEALVGRGGMGVVYRARHKGLDRVVALKVLAASVAADRAFADRFQREARALAKLQHPNIVGVHDFGVTDDLFWLVMEFVDGVNVREAMTAKSVGPKEALTIVPQICDALQYAHEHGVVHRDIKPENILLDRAGRVKVADFGLAKLTDRAAADLSLTGAGQVMGTLHYMAPEQWERPKDVDHRADIYSLGVVFYEMLTGELPVGRFAAPSTKTDVDARIDEIVMRTLAREREARYQQVSQVKTDVGAVAAAPVPAAAPSAVQVTHVVHTGFARGPRGQLYLGAVLAAVGAVWWAVKDCELVWTVLPLAGLAFMVIVVWHKLRETPPAQTSSRSAEFAVGQLVAAGGLMARIAPTGDERDQLSALAIAVGWLMASFGMPSLLAQTKFSAGTRRFFVGFLALAAAGASVVATVSLVMHSRFPSHEPAGTVADGGRSAALDTSGVSLRSPGKIGPEQRLDLEEIRNVWKDLRAVHASLDVEGALRLYVPDASLWVRSQVPARDVRDGTFGVPLANEKALRGPLSTLELRDVELDESGHFAQVEASDGVRRIKFGMTRYRVRASLHGDDRADRGAFRWAFDTTRVVVQ